MKKKMLSALLCVAMIAATLTGCGGSDSAPASGSTEAPAEEAPAEEAPAEEAPAEEAAEAPAAADGTLVYWSMWEDRKSVV